MGELAKKPDIILAREEILRAEPEFEQVSGAILSFRKEYQFAMQILEKNKSLLKTAMENPQSLKNAIVNVGAIGLSLNPAEKMAYLIPRDGAVCLDVSYMGLMKLAQMDGGILWGQAYVVRVKDKFERRGVSQEPIHIYDDFATEEERGPIKGAYTVVKTHDGSFLTTTMSIEAINKIRARSTSWKAYEKDNSKTNPWLTDPEEMDKKTVIKRAYKTWPKGHGTRLDKAIDLSNQMDGIEFDLNLPPQGKISDASSKLNASLGAPIDPEVKQVVESITDACKIICEHFTLKQKGGFMIKELQVNSFNELYLKDLAYLKELELHVLEKLNPTPREEEVIVDVPAWDDEEIK